MLPTPRGRRLRLQRASSMPVGVQGCSGTVLTLGAGEIPQAPGQQLTTAELLSLRREETEPPRVALQEGKEGSHMQEGPERSTKDSMVDGRWQCGWTGQGHIESRVGELQPQGQSQAHPLLHSHELGVCITFVRGRKKSKE